MKEKLFFFSIKHPVLYILSLAVVVRIIAMIFTDGWYLRLDNTFNNYHIPGSWLENRWIVYCSRFLLGAFSLLVITLSYRITKIIADKTTALEIATFGALLWAVPYLSVHPIASMVSLPFLLYGTLLILKQHNLLDNNEIEKSHRTTFIIAGFFLGLGFAVYYQSLIYYIGIIITLIILKNWKGALMTLIGFIVAVGLTQTVIDLVIYHRPFVAITACLSDIGSIFVRYSSGVWENFETTAIFLLLALVPPMSVMLVFGFFRVLRKYVLLVLPTFIALLYSIFVVNDMLILLMSTPTYIIAGYVGWKEFYKNSAFWTRNKWLIYSLYILFAVSNTCLMLLSFFF